MAGPAGFEPTLLVLETNVLPLTLWAYMPAHSTIKNHLLKLIVDLCNISIVFRYSRVLFNHSL